eukprot:11132953-Heterocapsa_arctica.AAC.1
MPLSCRSLVESRHRRYSPTPRAGRRGCRAAPLPIHYRPVARRPCGIPPRSLRPLACRRSRWGGRHSSCGSP